MLYSVQHLYFIFNLQYISKFAFFSQNYEYQQHVYMYNFDNRKNKIDILFVMVEEKGMVAS